MSKNVSVVVTDDLDGSAGAQTVAFGFDGINYEIDLAETNRARLEGTFAPFIEAGRKVTRGARRRGGPRPGGPSMVRAGGRARARGAGKTYPGARRIQARVKNQVRA